MIEALDMGQFSAAYANRFLLAAIRVISALSLNPFLGASRVPAQGRVGLALFVTAVLFPPGGADDTVVAGISEIIGEVLVGLAAGFAVTLIFFAAQLASGLIGVNSGFGFASTIDPFFDAGTGVIERFFSAFTMLVFVQINGHHLFLAGLRDLFEVVPLGQGTLMPMGIQRVTDLFVAVFAAGIKMALPVLAALLLADLALAILARVAPQFNLLAVGLPVKLLVGIAGLLVALPVILPRMTAVFRMLPTGMAGLVG
jgi:flagellar biosynthesis protein FliR